MYLTEMIKVLPTQSGRYLALTAALSHILKRQQHRPKIQHQLQEKKYSKVNQGRPCQVLKRCPAPAFPPWPQTRAPVHKRAGLLGSRTQQVHRLLGTLVGPKHDIRCPPTTSAGAALLRHAPAQAHASNGRAKMLLSVPPSRRQRMWTPSWPRSTEICPLRDLSRPRGPLRGVRRHRSAFTPAPNTGRLYPHSSANCSGPN